MYLGTTSRPSGSRTPGLEFRMIFLILKTYLKLYSPYITHFPGSVFFFSAFLLKSKIESSSTFIGHRYFFFCSFSRVSFPWFYVSPCLWLSFSKHVLHTIKKLTISLSNFLKMSRFPFKLVNTF